MTSRLLGLPPLRRRQEIQQATKPTQMGCLSRIPLAQTNRLKALHQLTRRVRRRPQQLARTGRLKALPVRGLRGGALHLHGQLDDWHWLTLGLFFTLRVVGERREGIAFKAAAAA